MRLSPLVENLKPSPTLVVSTQAKALRAKGIEVLDLSLGEPDFSTPEAIREAAKVALDEGYTKYTPVAGMMALREKIAQNLKKEKGFDYKPEQILVSTGAKQCLYNAILSVIGPGDEVLIPVPYWVSYPTQVQMAGGVSVPVQTRAEDHFQLDPKVVEAAITPKTKMLILNSPNNPTGVVYPPETIKAIAELVEKHNLWLLSDEIYDKLVYHGAQAVSPLEINPDLQKRTILINGFSKAYAMTGWRSGYMAAPVEVIKASIAIQGAITSGPNAITQRASIAALDLPNDSIENMRQTFQKRLDAILEAFNAIPGLVCPIPKGAFYLMPNFEAFIGKKTPEGQVLESSADITTYLLQEAHVAGVPGEAFAMPGHIRFSYATKIEIIQKAAKQIGEALQKLS